jgi:hypothetical protein
LIGTVKSGPLASCGGWVISIFDLLFIVCFLAAAISLLRAAYYACRRRWMSSARVLRRLGYGAGAYTIVLVAVSLTSSVKVLRMGERQCFDDWCISVERVARQSQIGERPAAANARGAFWLVTVKVSNAARRRAQRETDVGVCLIDPAGHRYYPSPPGQMALDATGAGGQELTTMMAPGGSFERTVVFDVPRDSTDLGLVVTHGPFPGVLIIGDSGSFLHAPTVVRLSKLEAR